MCIRKMDEIKKQIDELKQMQQFPRYYLSKYFDQLKAQVDVKYVLKLDEKEKYLEIIRHIESFEKDAYNKWNSKSINTFDNEINSIEEKLKINLNLTDITKLIDEVKYRIEKTLFSNKSILFIEKPIFDCVSNSFLLIINDEYISTKNCLNNDFDLKLVKRNELNDFIRVPDTIIFSFRRSLAPSQIFLLKTPPRIFFFMSVCLSHA
jgi:hypothetical protein